MLLVPPTATAGSNVIFLFFKLFLRFDPPCLKQEKKTCLTYPYYGTSLVSWVGDEPALFTLYCLTHPLAGYGMVDVSRKETAGRGARYQIDLFVSH